MSLYLTIALFMDHNTSVLGTLEMQTVDSVVIKNGAQT